MKKQKSDHELSGKEGMQELLKKNLKINEDMHEMLRDIKSYVFWRRVWTGIKILLIAIPLIVGAFYLPPLVKEGINKYSGYLNIGTGLNTQNNSVQNIQDWDKQQLQEAIGNLRPDQKEWVREALE